MKGAALWRTICGRRCSLADGGETRPRWRKTFFAEDVSSDFPQGSTNNIVMSVDEYLESLGKTLFLTVFPRAEKEEGLEPTQKVLLKSELGMCERIPCHYMIKM